MSLRCTRAYRAVYVSGNGNQQLDLQPDDVVSDPDLVAFLIADCPDAFEVVAETRAIEEAPQHRMVTRETAKTRTRRKAAG